MRKTVLLSVFILFFSVSCQKSEDRFRFVWSEATPSEVGIDQEILDSAYWKAEELGFVDAILVIRNGYLVAEEYYNGYSANMAHQVWSCTKSFMSALIGIAFDNGLIESLDKKVMDYFPEYEYEGMDQRFYDVTIRHLLTMRMGIDIEENNLIPVVQKSDWVWETFRLPLLYDPGQKFAYNSLQTHLLSVILTKVTGKSALMYANANLLGPMGIEIFEWRTDPAGHNTGGYDIFMKPRDMAVLGYMYLNDGIINNRQIVSGNWVESSLTKTWDRDGVQWGPLTDYNYGYLWWQGKINGYDMFMAMGMGGQYILNFPDLDLIVVTTTDKDITWDNGHEIPTLEIISDYILEAVN